jgi:enoyl-[acyl-carrier-protein] reductase (NADH)
LRRHRRRADRRGLSPKSKSIWGKLDFLVHAIAFSDKDELTGRYVETTEAISTSTMLISVYSFTAMCPARREADDRMAARC